MNKIIKKSISLSLVAILSLQTVNAGILDNAMESVTPAFKGKINGKNVYYSGGYSFRLNQASSIEAPWKFSSPEISASCNGLDFKGMFVSLISLDQFGDMLKEAGVALAWGIAVGLIYSLPGIFNVFKSLNQWAKKIQELLANACETGVQMGMALGESSGLKGVGDKISEWDKKATNALAPNDKIEKMQDGLKGKMQTIGMWPKNDGKSGTKEVPDEKKKEVISDFVSGLTPMVSIGGNMLNQLFLEAGAGKFRDFIKKQNTAGNAIVSTAVISLSENNIDDFVGGLSPESQLQWKFKLMGYALVKAVAGDIEYSSKSVANFAILNENLNKVLAGKSNKGKGVDGVSGAGSKDGAKEAVAKDMETPSGDYAPKKNLMVSNTQSAIKQIDDMLLGSLDGKDVTSFIPAAHFLVVFTNDKEDDNDSTVSFHALDGIPNNTEPTKWFFEDGFPGINSIAYNVVKSELEDVFTKESAESYMNKVEIMLNGQKYKSIDVDAYKLNRISNEADIFSKATREEMEELIAYYFVVVRSGLYEAFTKAIRTKWEIKSKQTKTLLNKVGEVSKSGSNDVTADVGEIENSKRFNDIASKILTVDKSANRFNKALGNENMIDAATANAKFEEIKERVKTEIQKRRNLLMGK